MKSTLPKDDLVARGQTGVQFHIKLREPKNVAITSTALPSSAQCASWVRAKPAPESKGANARANATKGHAVCANFFNGDDARANSKIASRVDGQFTGTTRQILRWAACKWGVDEDRGDAWGCVGRWFSGRWHTSAGEQYVTRVRGYLDQRIWDTPNFQQP